MLLELAVPNTHPAILHASTLQIQMLWPKPFAVGLLCCNRGCATSSAAQSVRQGVERRGRRATEQLRSVAASKFCPHKRRCQASQRSLHIAPIFRLLLKVAVNGTQQCDFLIFCGSYGPNRTRGTSSMALQPYCFMNHHDISAKNGHLQRNRSDIQEYDFP